MLTIRLQRVGKIKHPTYRLIVSEKARDTQDRYLEHLGVYDPHAKTAPFKPKAERIAYWLSKGAQTSSTVNNLLVAAGVITGTKRRAVYLSAKRKNKLADRQKAATAVASATPVQTPAA